MISADNGSRYTFSPIDAEPDPRIVVPKAQVDFDAAGSAASDIYLMKKSPIQPSRVLPALVAVFFGWLGADRFLLRDYWGGSAIFIGYLYCTMVLRLMRAPALDPLFRLELLFYVQSLFVGFGIVRAMVYLLADDRKFFAKHFARRFGLVSHQETESHE